jgi:hypothetical protein
MGRFFTNVHVRPSAPSRDTRAAVIAALEARATADGFKPVSADEDSDRLIAIGTAAPSGWTAVVDEETESQDTAALEQLAKTLSKAADGYAVSVLIHDSDVLDLRLFRNGRRLDHFVNQPDYFSKGALSAKARRAVQGNAATWAPLLRDDGSIAALERAFRGTPRFAEDTLAEIANLLGFGSGYDVGASDLREELVQGFEIRRFAGHEAGAPAARGEPRFQPSAWTPALTLSVGELLHWSMAVSNTGGPARGVALEISGSAIVRESVQLTRAICAVGRGDHDVDRAIGDLEIRNGRAIAIFPDVTIPSSSRRTPSPQLFVIVQGQAINEGTADLDIRVHPTEAPAGQATQHVRISIGPAMPRPLKAADATAAQALRDLQTPATLVAVVALNLSHHRAAVECLGAVTQWLGLLAGGQRAAFSTTTYTTGRPLRGRFSTRDIPDGEPWRIVERAMRESGGVYAQTGVDLKAPNAAASVMGPTHGFAFHVSHLFRDVEALSPHLAFWFDVRGKSEQEITRVRTGLEALIDRLTRSGHVHQAFLARWNWRPSLTLHATPYELACLVHGQCTTRHDWVNRFLHAVGEDVWLGPGLISRLPGFAPPDGTTLQPLGEAMRITCRDRAAVSALEHAVADLLPTHEDWKNKVLGG